MSKYLIAAIAVLMLLLAGAGMAIKKQLEIKGALDARITEQATALKAAEQLRQDAEDATRQRDKVVAKITETNRRLQNEITKALAGDACADLPIPAALDKLLHERAPKAGEGLPAGNRPASPPDPGVGR